MKYILRCMILGPSVEITIDETKYTKIIVSKQILQASFSIEEKYELLLSNYLELEKEALNSTVNYMVRESRDLSESFDNRVTFNRRIVNLLTSTKLYIDQASSDIKGCFPENKNIGDEVKSYFSQEYDACFEYRFMEALRNYVQHRGLAVHLTSNHMRWTSPKSEGQLEFNLSLYSQKNELEEDNGFKKQVLKEMPEKVELIHSARTYVSALSRIHDKIRTLLNEKSNTARTFLEDIKNEYALKNEGETIALSAVVLEDDSSSAKIVEDTPIFLDWDDVRLKLVEKNKILINLDKRYVSNSAYNNALAADRKNRAR